jgi:aspartyl-tRNA(Asn)/glutamyl-tRNA(Gln) amidotransferase subunit B
MNWEPVIGLEIHAQLATASKIFSGASTAYGAEPNCQASLIDLGFPGVLPVINGEALTMAIRFGLAIDAKIAERTIFARKNYFYPDLPKGYQISQYEDPIVANGAITIDLDSDKKIIRITRAHLEEDAGKSVHDVFEDQSGIDLNRAGTPLLEIVSEPDLGSSAEAVAYMRKIHSLVRYLEICDGNMQEGSFRCDANVSVRPLGTSTLGTRTEIKNINSFRFVQKAIDYEIHRQIDLLEEGAKVVQETRLYDPDKDETRSMRQKEEANDYRYFPDPDLLPVVIYEKKIDEVRATLPELPDARLDRFKEQYGLNDYDATQLTQDKAAADFFEEAVLAGRGSAKLAANWILSELTGRLKREDLEIDESPVSPKQLGLLIERIEDKTISSKIAKQIFERLFDKGGDVDDIIKEEGLEQLSDDRMLETLVEQVLNDNPAQVDQYRSGKEKVLGFFVGQVMKLTGGKADPAKVNSIVREKLKK